MNHIKFISNYPKIWFVVLIFILILYFFFVKILILDFEPTDAFKMHFYIIMLLNCILIYVNVDVLFAIFRFITIYENIMTIPQIIQIKRQLPIDMQMLLYEKTFIEFQNLNLLTQEEFITLTNLHSEA